MRTLGNKSNFLYSTRRFHPFDGHGVLDNRGSCWEAAIATLPNGGFPFPARAHAPEAGRTFLSGGRRVLIAAQQAAEQAQEAAKGERGGLVIGSLGAATISFLSGVEKLLRRSGWYRFVWHKNLVRVALFVIVYSEQVIVTDQRGSGESFKRLKAKAGGLYLADHAHGVRPGIFYLREPGADVLVCFALDNLPLQDAVGGRWDLLKHLRRLGSTQVGDWAAELALENGFGG